MSVPFGLLAASDMGLVECVILNELLVCEYVEVFVSRR